MRRLLGMLVAGAFLAGAASLAAQFPGMKKKKEEKPAATSESKSESKEAISADTMQAVAWADNGITLEVPSNWDKLMLERDIASYMLMPATDGAGISLNISRMGKDFPAAQSMKANRDDAAKKKSNGQVTEVADVTAGKVKGVMYIEAAPASGDDVRRMTWIGFQKKNGWNQVTVHLSAKGSAFAKHEPALRKVLATLKVESE